MPSPAIACDRCATPLPAERWNVPGFVPCARCGSRLQAVVFPAFFRGLAASHAPLDVMSEEEASCFAHPRKRAVVPCDSCGRFLCAICDVELDGRHICPSCLESGKKKGRLKNLENERTLYDRIALSLAIYPILTFYLTFITAPIALYIAIRYWKAPGSLVGRTKARFVAAVLLSLLQIAGWVVLSAYLIRAYQAGEFRSP